MTSVEESAIVEKIRKLLALADGNQNNHERDRAMEAAMDLLARHNLSLSEITPAEAAACVQAQKADFRLEAWVKSVLMSACKLYYTAYYVQEEFDYVNYREIKYPIFVGTKENIAVTIEMSIWLLDSIRKESNRMYRTDADRRSFRWGAADAISERVDAMMKAEKQAADHPAPGATGASLMVLRTQLERANDEYMGTLNLRYTKARTSYVKPDAYANGEVFGEQVHLQSRAQASKGIAGYITSR
jgi:hypothetical protein